jgi:hypothetical protein
MFEMDWQTRFREVYDRAVRAYDEDGARRPEECVSKGDQEFLASIGCTAQEVYDFAEDWCWSREPSFDEVLAVTAIRRDYFMKVQGGKPSDRKLSAGNFPPGTAAVDGISWLPRLLAKARAKLRGELPAQLMYGCGGDRPFLSSVGVGLSEFLAAVRDSPQDDRPVVELVRRRAKGR